MEALLNEKHRLLQKEPTSVEKKTAFTNIHREVQLKHRKMQDDWLYSKAEEIQTYADTNDSKRFHDNLKTIMALNNPAHLQC